MTDKEDGVFRRFNSSRNILYSTRFFFFSSMEKQHFEGMKPLKNKSVRFRCFGYINAAFADRTVGNGCITMENNKRNLLTLS